MFWREKEQKGDGDEEALMPGCPPGLHPWFRGAAMLSLEVKAANGI